MKMKATRLAAAFGAASFMLLCSCHGKDVKSMLSFGSSDADKETTEEVSDVVNTVSDDVSATPAVTVIKADGQIPPADGKLVVLDFNATWCGPCRQFAPNFHKVAEKYADRASFYSIDVDENPRLAAQYNIQSIPTVVYLLPDGTYAASMGYMDTAEFDAAVASHL